MKEDWEEEDWEELKCVMCGVEDTLDEHFEIDGEKYCEMCYEDEKEG